MRIYKYPFLNHRDPTTDRKHEIYTLDVSIQGKLATGAIDGRVCLWDINGLKENDSSKIHKTPLCSMTRHDGAITCVRFSPNGRFLASGSDDKLVLIWEIDEEKSKIMKGNRNTMELIGDSNINDLSMGGELEHWTVRKRLVAHDNDVQDMAWAPDGSILVSVGLDRSIVVWSGTTFEKIKRFDIHQSHVKGVTFDPAGKYFVTCSDDRTMRVFHYRKGISDSEMSFTIEAIVRTPFEKSPLSTYFRRCSWSPDGLYVAAPNGVNDGISANPIIKRGTWEREVSLIGHRLPSEVCAFSPRLYDVGDDKVDTILISAGQDRTIALWSTNCSTPLCVLTEISMKSITDISWSSNGIEVYLCSLDGDVIIISFDDFELGRILPWEETLEALNRYGKDRDVKFTESVAMMELEQVAKRKFNHLMNSNNSDSTSTRLKQLMSGSSEGLQSSSQKSSTSTKINMLVGRSKKNPNRRMPQLQSVESPISQTSESLNTNVNILTPATQKVTITKSGKKRLTPMLISTTINETSVTTATSTVLKRKNNTNANKLSFISHPSVNLPKYGLPTLVSSLIQVPLEEINSNEDTENTIDDIIEADLHSTNNKRRGERKNNNRYNDNNIKKYNGHIPSWINNTVINPMTMFGEKNQCEVHVEIKNIEKEEEKDKEEDQVQNWIKMNHNNEQILEIRYNTEISRDNEFQDPFENEFKAISQIVAKSNDSMTPQWDNFICDKMTAIDESHWEGVHYWALGFDTGKIYILSLNGRLISPIITLGSPIIKLISEGSHLCAITESGELWSWKLFKLKHEEKEGKRFQCIIDGASLAPLLNQYSIGQDDDNNNNGERKRRKIEIKISIKEIKYTPKILYVILTNGDTFTWDLNLQCWIKVIDKWLWDQLITSNKDNSINIIKKLASKDNGLAIIIRNLIRRDQYDTKCLIKSIDKQICSNQLDCVYNHL